MQCHNCGTQLSLGVQFCPNCGTAAPDHVSQAAPIDPTVVASPYQPSPIPPTSYGAPPPPPSNMPVSDPYAGSSTPPVYNMPGQQTPYGYNATPMPQASNSYQQYTPIPNYNPAQPFPMPPTTPSRKNPTGLIIGITAAVLIVIIVGLFVILPKPVSKPTTPESTTNTQNSNTSTPNVEITPTPVPNTNSSTGPSGNTIDPTAASIVIDPQTSTDVNTDTAAPINPGTTFKTSTDFYVTFKLNNNAFDFSKNTGYVSGKFYARSQLAFSANPITIDHITSGGYFKIYYNVATPGTAELYWCQQSDCSDAKLAQIVTFTVTS